MFKSIRTSIIVLLLSIILIANGIIGYYTISQSYHMIEKEAKKGLSAVLQETQKLINSRIESEFIFLQEIANNEIIDGTENWEEKVSYLQEKADSRGYIVFARIEMDGEITRYDLEKSKGFAGGRDYFDKAKGGDPAVSDIIISSVTEEPIIVIAVPIIRNGKVVGVLNGVRPQTGINSIIEDFKYGDTGTVFLVNRQGMIMAHTNMPYVLEQTNFIELLSSKTKINPSLIQSYLFTPFPITTKFENEKMEVNIYAINPMEGSNWVLIASVSENDIFSNVNKLRTTIIFSIILVLIFSILSSYIFTTKLIKPLIKITEKTNQMAHGNLSVEIDKNLLYKKDEIGILGKSFEIMREKLYDSFEEIKQINLHLEDKVKERTEELVVSNAELSKYIDRLENTQNQLIDTQKQLTLASLIKWIAHHMNTPLGNILSSLSFIKANLAKEEMKNLEYIEESINIIDRNSQKLINIIDSLKKISINDDINKSQEFNLVEFITESTKFLKEDSGNMKIEFECEDNINIVSKPIVILQTLSILIENALVHAYTDTEIKTVKINMYKDENYAYIKVIDYGKGIKENHSIFTPFYEKISAEMNGGLGLQVAYQQVTIQLKGYIYHEYTNIGTTIVVKIPKNI